MNPVSPNLSYEKWRRRINRALLLIAGLIFLTECAVYLIFHSHGIVNGIDDLTYILTYILAPSALNFGAIAAGMLVQNSTKLSETVKNYTVEGTILILCFTVSIIHYVVTAAWTFYCVPVFCTVLFADLKMTRIIGAVSVSALTMSVLHAIGNGILDGIFATINLIASYLFVAASYLLARVLITYQQENRCYLLSSYQIQLKFSELAKRDSLTGLYNQGTFYLVLQSLLDGLEESKGVLSLAVLDLDGFKQINDSYGHSVGDRVLETLSRELVTFFGEEQEYIFRYGGEEFCIIFRGNTADDCYRKMEEFRRYFYQIPFQELGKDRVTFSAGIVDCDDSSVPVRNLFDAADNALYRAKGSGKNQVAVNILV